jgi:hypothetical protein
MKVIRLTDTQANVLFHILNNTGCALSAIQEEAKESDGISRDDFVRAHNSVLLAVMNAENEIAPKLNGR